MIHILKWWIVYILILSATFLFFYSGLFFSVLAADVTFISIGILLLTIISSTFLGIDFYRLIFKNKSFNQENYMFIASTMTKLGFLGTLIGLIILVDIGTISQLTSGDIDNTKLMFNKMIVGIGTAVYTTMFGLIADLIVKFQILLVRNYLRENNKNV